MILNTHNAPPAQLQALPAIRRGGTTRHSLFMVTPNVSNRNLLSVMPFLNAAFLALIWKTWTRYLLIFRSWCVSFSFLSLIPSHLVTFRRQPPSKRLSLCSSRATHDSMVPPGYPPMPPYYPCPNRAPYPLFHIATSPRLQSSLAPNVPAPHTAHSFAAPSSRSVCASSYAF